jgi:hypothetical protein
MGTTLPLLHNSSTYPGAHPNLDICLYDVEEDQWRGGFVVEIVQLTRMVKDAKAFQFGTFVVDIFSHHA